MTSNQYLWAQARERLAAVIGFPAELVELMAGQPKSPGAVRSFAVTKRTCQTSR